MAKSDKPFNPVSAEREADAQIKKFEQRKKTLFQRYLAEPKVSVSISPMYANYFGHIMPVEINGVHIDIPVDGVAYEIPETFASECFRRTKAIDRLMTQAAKRADVNENGEVSPGSLQLY